MLVIAFSVLWNNNFIRQVPSGLVSGSEPLCSYYDKLSFTS